MYRCVQAILAQWVDQEMKEPMKELFNCWTVRTTSAGVGQREIGLSCQRPQNTGGREFWQAQDAGTRTAIMIGFISTQSSPTPKITLWFQVSGIWTRFTQLIKPQERSIGSWVEQPLIKAYRFSMTH